MTEAGEKWAIQWAKDFLGFTHEDAKAAYMKQAIRTYESVLRSFVDEVEKRASESTRPTYTEIPCRERIAIAFEELTRELLGP